jgi:NADH:ubiquinone oxidoreductase subunit 5 (subunit L)/multisubunit Na+/H+ antiporter MnhA subunit
MPIATLILLAVFLPALLTPVMALAARRTGAATGYLGSATLAVSTSLLLSLFWARDDGTGDVIDFAWVPSLGVNLTFLIDGLSLFHGLIICGIGTLVCWYAASYLGEKYSGHGRFYACLMLFVTAMLGTVFSDNSLVMFVFWELTGVASFLLIGFFHSKDEARAGARRAFLTTAGTGLGLLAGLIMLGLAAGTYSFSEMARADDLSGGRGTPWMEASMVLVMLGIFGKSAQFPFHFWLPGAMVAPTPVSVFLHSATMVKLGVFLTARVFPVFSELDLWFPLLASVCFFTMLFGAWMALRCNDLKAILAYTTVSQLGMLIACYGLGSLVGVRFDYLFILTHVFYKAALFMIAGIVDHATGTRDLRELGGLAKKMPLLAVGTAICAAALAGLPFTAGFLSKESLLAELLGAQAEHPLAGGVILAAVLVSAVFSVAVAARIFIKTFLGETAPEQPFYHPGWKIGFPVVLLSAATLLLGTFPNLYQAFFDSLRVMGLHEHDPVELEVWHGFNLELGASLVALVAGAWLYRREDQAGWKRTHIPAFLCFDVMFDRGLDGLNGFAKRLTRALRADSPAAYLPIIISFLLLAVCWTVATSEDNWLEPALPDWSFHPLRMALVALVTAAVMGVVFLRRWTAQLVSLSLGGFFITLYFVLSRAPDLAMTQILVESASVVMMLLLLSRFPSSSQIGVRLPHGWSLQHIGKLGLSIGIGLLMALLVLFVEPNRHPDPVGPHYLELSRPLADGSNAVNTILVDFRGFDTLGEITVLLVATLGSLGLMMRYRRTRPDAEPPPGFMLGSEKKP